MKKFILFSLTLTSLSSFAGQSYLCDVSLNDKSLEENIEVELQENYASTVYEFKDGSKLEILGQDYNWSQGKDFGEKGLRMSYVITSPAIESQYIVAGSSSPSRKGVGLKTKHALGDIITSRCLKK